MTHWMESALAACQAGVTVALATIVSSQGSTPRAVGTKMLVHEDGTIEGTVGGGEMERRVIEEAKVVLSTGRPLLLHYSFREVEGDGVGICGGENDVFIEMIAPPEELLIVGAGHVGKCIAELGSYLGMDCTVFDSRSEYANRERFPKARKVIVGEIANELSAYPIGPKSYIVIVTRGHLEDANALEAVIRTKAAYIGMIGSRRKVLRVNQMMQERGVDPSLLKRVVSPIGLDIGAETPEEIAVSVLSQIIAVQKGRTESLKSAAAVSV